jgi:Uma2 family endonuclease
MTTMTEPRVDLGRGSPWTVEDLLDLPDGRYEILDGSLLVSPVPTNGHAYTTDALTDLLKRQAPAGVVVFAVGVGLLVRGGASYFVPDVLVFRRRALDLPGRGIEPDDALVAIEVLSPSNPGNDLFLKRREYAAAGIPRYWIVDREKQSITVLTLDESGREYIETAIVGSGERLRVEQPFPISFDPAQIW